VSSHPFCSPSLLKVCNFQQIASFPWLRESWGKMADAVGPDAVLLYAHPSRCALGEGAVWDPHTQRLLWVDIVRGKCHTHTHTHTRTLTQKQAGCTTKVCVPLATTWCARVRPRSRFALTQNGAVLECTPLAPSFTRSSAHAPSVFECAWVCLSVFFEDGCERITLPGVMSDALLCSLTHIHRQAVQL
jgi:hypothetical protein